MIKTITLELSCIAEGQKKTMKRIVDVEDHDWFSLQQVAKEIDASLDKFGKVSIPEKSEF